MPDSTQRFSDRVEAYQKYRPSYPAALIDTLLAETQLPPEAHIADLGAGTGIFTKLLLERGLTVTAVEPNAPMREAAAALQSDYPSLTLQDGIAEATGLPDTSCHLAVAAQAFHWFDQPRAKKEIARILRPGGQLALIFNERLTATSPFLHDYDALLRELATDYTSVNHANLDDAAIAAFYTPNSPKLLSFPNSQTFDWAGLRGRCQSSSYVPAENHPQHAPFYRELEALFNRHQQNGHIHFVYQTKLYLAPIHESAPR